MRAIRDFRKVEKGIVIYNALPQRVKQAGSSGQFRKEVER